MSIKFIEKNIKEGEINFSQVQEGQFFINLDGDLCQKHGDNSYHTIANSYGKPKATWDQDYEVAFMTISKILPIIEKIEF